MIRIYEIIKYIGVSAILYCLLKAMCGSDFDDGKISLLIAVILGMLILSDNKQQCKLSESYAVTNPPLIDSIYPGPSNMDTPDIIADRRIELPYEDSDLRDMKDVMNIDKKTYDRIINQEKEAKDKISSRYVNEMVYTETNPFNTVPLGTQLYGYTFLPPENWFRGYEQPPVCIIDKPNKVSPLLSDTVVGLMEFDTSKNVMGPNGIDLRYIKKHLNKE